MSILDLVPVEIFVNDIGKPEHDEYIKSGNYYEHYYELSKKYQPKSILEIGVRYGYSLCSMFAGSRDTVEYIEGWDNNTYEHNALEIARINLIFILHYKGRLVLKNIDSHSVQSLDRDFSLIHIDGDHGYYGKLQDLELVKNRCRVLILDDYNYIPEVHSAIDKFVNDNKNLMKNYYVIDSIRGTFVIEFN